MTFQHPSLPFFFLKARFVMSVDDFELREKLHGRERCQVKSTAIGLGWGCGEHVYGGKEHMIDDSHLLNLPLI